MKYKTVLFDLDGTLLDTTEGVISAVIQTISNNKLPMPDVEALKRFVGPPMQKTMSEQFGLDEKKALEIANEFRFIYKQSSLFKASLYEGILSLLGELRKAGYKIGVATNKSHENAVQILEKFGVARYCDCMLGSDLEGKLSKKDIISLCIKKMGSSTKETVLIGDSDFDLIGAEQTNIDFIGVTYGFGFKKGEQLHSKSCVFMADNVEELRGYLLD